MKLLWHMRKYSLLALIRHEEASNRASWAWHSTFQIKIVRMVWHTVRQRVTGCVVVEASNDIWLAHILSSLEVPLTTSKNTWKFNEAFKIKSKQQWSPQTQFLELHPCKQNLTVKNWPNAQNAVDAAKPFSGPRRVQLGKASDDELPCQRCQWQIWEHAALLPQQQASGRLAKRKQIGKNFTIQAQIFGCNPQKTFQTCSNLPDSVLVLAFLAKKTLYSISTTTQPHWVLHVWLLVVASGHFSHLPED